MRLKTARVRNYRSIRDTGEFDVERTKTILVGPNEAGKSALLQALQQIRAPKGVKGFDALRDYPRALYNDITTGKVKPEQAAVATVTFELDDSDRDAIPESLRGVGYTVTRYLDNSVTHALVGAPQVPVFGTIAKDLARLAAHIDGRTAVAEGQPPSTAQAAKLAAITEGWRDTYLLTGKRTSDLRAWLEAAVTMVDDSDPAQDQRLDRISAAIAAGVEQDKAR